MGDHMAGMAAAGAVAAALLARERTGEGQLVSTSLLRIGMYMMGWDISMSLRLGIPVIPMTVKAPPNPLINAYTAGDGRRFWMLGLQADRHWPDVLRAVDRAEWADDARFNSIEARWQHSSELVDELSTLFATKPLSEWAAIFDREDVWWAPVQYAHETIDDPQAAAAGGFVEVPAADGAAPVRMVATPVDFAGTPWSATVDATRVRATHRGGVARARLRLGRDRRARRRGRHPVGNGSSTCSTARLPAVRHGHELFNRWGSAAPAHAPVGGLVCRGRRQQAHREQ